MYLDLTFLRVWKTLRLSPFGWCWRAEHVPILDVVHFGGLYTVFRHIISPAQRTDDGPLVCFIWLIICGNVFLFQSKSLSKQSHRAYLIPASVSILLCRGNSRSHDLRCPKSKPLFSEQQVSLLFIGTSELSATIIRYRWTTWRTLLGNRAVMWLQLTWCGSST